MTDKKNIEQTGYPSIDKPWLKYYSEEAIKGVLPECSIYEYMYENNKKYPCDIAINYLGRRISYGKMFKFIDKTASAFVSLGVKKGDIVTIALPSIPEALYCVYALNKIGAVANMIHPLAGQQETLNYLDEVGSKVIVIFDGTYKILGDKINKTDVECAIVVSAGESLKVGIKQIYNIKNHTQIYGNVYHTWKWFIKNREYDDMISINKDCHEMAIISHTGGTTGDPKGVMLSDYNINSVIWQISQRLSYGRQEKNFVVLPPFVNYSLVNGMLAPIAFGFTAILVPNYQPERFMEYIKKYQPNHLMASIPAYYEPLLKINDINEKVDLTCLSHIYYGGDKMLPNIEIELNTFLLDNGAKHPLAKGLGSTEMVSSAIVTFDDINTIESVGIPLVKISCKIVDEDNTEMKFGIEGEICMTGPSLMLGYYKNQYATDEVIKVHKDGVRWLHTGDIGYIDEDGKVYITGRIKRIIMTRGKDNNPTKLFPDRIEKVICKNGKVEICCIIGIPHEERINYPKAYIVLKEGIKSSSELTKEILLICRNNLPDYMIPEEIEYRESLPRTDRGKIDYRALENEI